MAIMQVSDFIRYNNNNNKSDFGSSSSLNSQNSNNKNNSNNSRGGSDTQFPGKLHDMLSYVEQNGLEHIISWNERGDKFRVNDPEKLVNILPNFFGQTKYRSFRRQLNMWSFERLLDGPDKGSFSHPFFIRGQKLLCRQMSRHHSKTNLSQKVAQLRRTLDLRSQQQHEQQQQEVGRVVSASSSAEQINNGCPPSLFGMNSNVMFDVCSMEAQRNNNKNNNINNNNLAIRSLQSNIIMDEKNKIMSSRSSSDSLSCYHDGDLVTFDGMPFYYVESRHEEEEWFLTGDEDLVARNENVCEKTSVSALSPSLSPQQEAEKEVNEEEDSCLFIKLSKAVDMLDECASLLTPL